MEKARRDHLRSKTGEARRLAERTLTQQLNRYGLFTDAEPLSLEEISLPDDHLGQYRRVLDAIRRDVRATSDQPKDITPEAVSRYVREAGSTWINRLAALRALEARGLLRPAAAFVSEDYAGLSPRANELREREPSLKPQEALRLGLENAFRELSTSVRVLFDLDDEQSLFWPDPVALRELLRIFSVDVTEADWREPDVLGWVYQYYNTDANDELKKRKKRTTGFKYQPDDIPIANQFYTPDWVVRVLADNTLGRTWLEMHGRAPQMCSSDETVADGSTLKRWRLEEHRLGIPHAADEADAFKQWLAEEPDPQRDLTVDRLCRFLVPLPSEAPPRPQKSVRELKVLDPACGSGHFLLYAFDVLFAMYREAEPTLPQAEIPALILENNLHGIDIDLRAAQLAAFALYLKARTTLAAIDPAAPLNVRRLNIVIADAHIGDDPRKAAFLDRYADAPEVQELYRKLLADVDNTNVLGSLLKVRAEFERLFGRISESSRRRAGEAGSLFAGRQQELFSVTQQQELRDVFTAHGGRQFRLEDLLDDLRAFEREVLPQQDIGARLFYTDLARTVGLVTLLSQRYDVVLMNPPYGDMAEAAKDYAKGNKQKKIGARYPRTHEDYATAFLDQAVDLLREDAFVGMLVSRSFMHLNAFEAVRTDLLWNDSRPELVLDLGRGILDRADVRVCASVVRKRPADKSATPVVFNRLAYFRDSERPARFLDTFPGYAARGADDNIEWFVSSLHSFQDVPGMPYAYWPSDTLRALFRANPPLDRDQRGVLVAGRPSEKVADAKQGLATADDSRFLRAWFEVPPHLIGRGKRWVPFVKGVRAVGFAGRIDVVVNWENDGRELKAWAGTLYGGSHWSRIIKNTDRYYEPGVTWPARSWRTRVFGLVPPDCIFSHTGTVILPKRDGASALYLCGVLNSLLLNALKFACNPERKWEVGLVASLPVRTEGHQVQEIVAVTAALVELCAGPFRGDETTRAFERPQLQQLLAQGTADCPNLVERLLEMAALHQKEDEARRQELEARLDELSFDLYEVGPLDRALVQREMERRPAAEGGYSAGEEEPEEDAPAGSDEPADGETDPAASSDGMTDSRSLISRCLSYYVKQLIEADDDGIVPVHAENRESALIIRVRDLMVADLGRDVAAALEAQSPAYLGSATLEDWLSLSAEENIQVNGKKHRVARGFFPWHVALYQNRPIFWLLSSENFERGEVHYTWRAFIHYLKLTPDTLPRVRAFYLDPAVDRAQRDWEQAKLEAASAEGKMARAATANAQKWGNTVAALTRFRDALTEVIDGPVKADRVPDNARWLQRTMAAVRGGRDLGHGYKPDVDLGVRVNIAPLVKARLIPRVVLARLGG